MERRWRSGLKYEGHESANIEEINLGSGEPLLSISETELVEKVAREKDLQHQVL